MQAATETLSKKSTELGGIANLALLAPVKPGFIPNAEAFSYADRLEAFFKALNAMRLVGRESAIFENPFPDAIGRWGLLHAFRYGLVPPEIGSDGGPPAPDTCVLPGVSRLYLNVTFDGGWEPYMRVIYRDLGSLLDTIFSNCQGYPATVSHSYGEYIAWVRSREVAAGTFYAESATSVLDQRYLAAVETIERNEPSPARARQAIAGLALPPPLDIPAALARFAQAGPDAQQETIVNNLRALKGLYDLRAFYPANDDGDGDCLLRFTRQLMPEFAALLPGLLNDPRIGPGLAGSAPQIDWLLHAALSGPPGAAAREPARRVASEIQTGILSGYGRVTHGALFLLAVTDAPRARAWLAALPVTTEDLQPLPAGALHCNLAFSYWGLVALAGPALPTLPQEFVDGMEARAGLLGDWRNNHPDHWRRPVFDGVEVDLDSVHVVLQYRLVDGASADGGAALHERLAAIEADLRHPAEAAARGLLLLATEPMRSRLAASGMTREHFGFEDGFSQPALVPAAPGPHWDNTVEPGELFLGSPGDRGGGIFPAQPDALLDNGSFLVLRKIAQHVDRWHRVLGDAAAAQGRPAAPIAAKLMGRATDGTPAVDPALPPGFNDFNYDNDPQGSRCPFQSHIRRANPRSAVGGHKVPRLTRRGMSYGPRFETDPDPAAGRGLLFMAYCGSIAEQFEIVQRWIAGGNSSGVLAAHSDPLLGVPQKGQSRSFHWLDEGGNAVRVELGDEPLTELQWGLYLFAPSKTGLAVLTGAGPAAAPPLPLRGLNGEPYRPHGERFEQRRQLLQARKERGPFWARVNETGGQLQTAYGLLCSKPSTVLEILQDDGSQFSVCGYGRRFEASIGAGYLGMDPALGHTTLAERSGINDAVAAIDEAKAFEAASRITQSRLPAAGQPGEELPVDLIDLSEQVLAALCTEWFGLPDGRFMQVGTSASPMVDEATDVACCPRDLVYVARLIFGPHPSERERTRGIRRGQALQRAVKASLASGAAPVGLSATIHGALAADHDLDVVAHTIAGIMLGFAPSVHGNYVNIVRAWIEERRPGFPSLWDVQVRLRAAHDPARPYTSVRDVLRPLLMAQMREEPVPPSVWRERPGPAIDEARAAADEPPKIVLGLQGVMQDPAVPDIMMFGGARPGGALGLQTVHACPGYGMATGVLLGVFSALLLAGTLRKTPSPTILSLVRGPGASASVPPSS